MSKNKGQKNRKLSLNKLKSAVTGIGDKIKDGARNLSMSMERELGGQKQMIATVRRPGTAGSVPSKPPPSSHGRKSSIASVGSVKKIKVVKTVNNKDE